MATLLDPGLAGSEDEPVEVLLQFRAGRMNLVGSRVQPDPRRGLLRIVRGDDLLLHVQWLDRSSSGPLTVEEDIVVFPDEATFQRVEQSTGRVFFLSFSSDNRKFFYWMQEPEPENDDALCAEFNQRLNEGLAVEDDEEEEDSMMESMMGGEPMEGEVSGAAGASGPAGVGQALEAALRRAAQELGTSGSTGQTARAAPSVPVVLGGSGLGAAGAVPGGMDPARAAAALAASLQLGAMKNLVAGLSTIQVPPELLALVDRQRQQMLQMVKEPGLTEVLNPQVLLPVLNDPTAVERLRPHLPDALQSKEEMQQLVQSPQFQQQLDTLSLLLRSGRIDLVQFGIDVNQYGYGVLSFLRAIQEKVPPTQSGEGGPATEEGAASSKEQGASAQGTGDKEDEKPADP